MKIRGRWADTHRMDICRILVCTASTLQALALVLLLRLDLPGAVAAVIILFSTLFGLLSQHPRLARWSIWFGALIFSALCVALAGFSSLVVAAGSLWSGRAALPVLGCMLLIFFANATSLACLAAQGPPVLARA